MSKASLWRGGWRVIEQSGAVNELVQIGPTPSERVAIVRQPADRAVVLGSMQQKDVIDADRLASTGLSVLGRRSGGGAVIVAPHAQLWVDLFVPASDVLHDHDTQRASHFVGELWQAALERVEPGASCRVYAGHADSDDWAKRVCFAGIGPGEVLLGDKKLVGVSQRRTREGAWFFTMAMCEFDAALHAALFGRDDADERASRARLDARVAVLGVSASALAASLVALLGDRA